MTGHYEQGIVLSLNRYSNQPVRAQLINGAIIDASCGVELPAPRSRAWFEQATSKSGAWICWGAVHQQKYVFEDDFVLPGGQSPNANWSSLSVIGGSVTALASDPGAIILHTSAATNAFFQLKTDNIAVVPQYPAAYWLTYRFQPTIAQQGGIFGLMDDKDFEAPWNLPNGIGNGVIFYFDQTGTSSTSPTAFFTDNGTTRSSIVAGPIINTDWHVLDMVMSSAWCGCWVDGAGPIEITTNIPSGGMAIRVGSLTRAAVDRLLVVDYVCLKRINLIEASLLGHVTLSTPVVSAPAPGSGVSTPPPPIQQSNVATPIATLGVTGVGAPSVLTSGGGVNKTTVQPPSVIAIAQVPAAIPPGQTRAILNNAVIAVAAVPTPSISILGALHVSGKNIVDAASNRKILRGINQYIVPAYDSPGQQQLTTWFSNTTNLASHALQWKANGINLVRVPVYNDTTAGYANTLKNVVSTLASFGIYTLLTPYDFFGDTHGFPAWETSGAPFNIASIMAAIYSSIGKPVGCLLEMVNEPHGVTPAQWASQMVSGFATLRSTGYQQPIFVTGYDWGWNFSLADAQTMLASDTNLVFCGHRFAVTDPLAPVLDNTDPGASTGWKGLWPDVCGPNNIACIVTAFGPYNGGYGANGSFTSNVSNWCTAMSTAIQNAVGAGNCQGGIGWMWLWDENPADVGVSMIDPSYLSVITGSSWTLNAWGTVVLNMCISLAGGTVVTPSSTATPGPVAALAGVFSPAVVTGGAPPTYSKTLNGQFYGGTTWSATDATSYNFTVSTPTANNTVFAFVASTAASPATPSSVSGLNLTWTQRTSVVNGGVRLTLYTGTGASPSGTTFTVNFGATQTACGASLEEFASASGTPNTATATATAASITATLGAAPTSGMMIACGARNYMEGVQTPYEWTLLNGDWSTEGQFLTQYTAVNDQNITFTYWNDTDNKVAIIAEVVGGGSQQPNRPLPSRIITTASILTPSITGATSNAVVLPLISVRPVGVPAPTIIVPPPGGGSLTPLLHVSGKFILNPSNQRVVLMGLNQYCVEPYYFNGGDSGIAPFTNWMTSNISIVAQDWFNRGVRCVRMPIRRDGNGGPSDPGYFSKIKTITDGLAAKGIYTAICGFDIGSFGGFNNTGATNSGNYFISLWNFCGKPSWLMFNVFNEPNNISNATWVSMNQAAITAVRNGGYTGPVFMDSINWGWNYMATEFAQMKAFDSNSVFCSHRYHWNGVGFQASNDWSANWTPEWPNQAGSQNVCFVGGEAGWYNDGGNLGTALGGWLQGCRTEYEAAINAGNCQGCWPWMYAWDSNSFGYDFFQITQGNMSSLATFQAYENGGTNGWGTIAWQLIGRV